MTELCSAAHAPAVERSMRLPSDPSSAGQARRFVRALLTEHDLGRWSEAAELAVSELVTNAVLHARTDIDLTAELNDQALTVRVADQCPAIPVSRAWGTTATTGRGLRLLATTTAEHGVTPVPPNGKEVWFRIDDTVCGDDTTAACDEQAISDLDLSADSEFWNIDDADWDLPAADPTCPGETAVLLGVPVLLWLSAQQHYESILREMYLLHADGKTRPLDLAGAGDALRCLTAGIDAAVRDAPDSSGPVLPAGHPAVLPAVPAQVDAAIDRGCGTGSFTALLDVLDAADDLAHDGLLLNRPSLPEILALGDWACDQVIAQSAGVPAGTWAGAGFPAVTDEPVRTADLPDWDSTPVTGSDLCLLAVDDSNRIVACSAPLTELLGWPADELVGHRVVKIIPERLREAHIAGFTRHLTTGETRVLGVEVNLPVLLPDGTELTCQFLIDQATAGEGRAVYVARLTPAEPTA